MLQQQILAGTPCSVSGNKQKQRVHQGWNGGRDGLRTSWSPQRFHPAGEQVREVPSVPSDALEQVGVAVGSSATVAELPDARPKLHGAPVAHPALQERSFPFRCEAEKGMTRMSSSSQAGLIYTNVYKKKNGDRFEHKPLH